MQKAYLATNFQRKKEQFDTIFSAEAHETLRKRGLRRFSLKALQVKFSEKASKIWCKVHIFWEGHKIMRNLHLIFDCVYFGQK